MASVRRTPAGTWQVRYRDPAGRLKGRTFKRKDDAVRYGRHIEEARDRGTWTDPAKGKTKFDDWAKVWFESTVNLRPTTRARDETYIRVHLVPYWGTARLNTISQVDVRQWISDLVAKGLAPATVHRCFQLLAKILRAAVDAGLIPVTPCRGIDLPRIERKEMRFLTPEEVRTLADTIHPRYRALVLVAAYGGLRFGELAGLRWSRVDLDDGVIAVAEIVTEVKGHHAFGPPKTNAGRRRVTLPASVVEELRAHKEAWATDRSDLVFTSPEGAPLRNSLFRRRFFDPAVETAGLEPLRPHDLRHTAVSLWIAAGGHPRAIAARAGHTSVSVVLDRYGHLMPNADRELSDALDDLINAAS